jgi:hypothetical protein
MASPAFIIATVMGIAPALVGMYYILRRFSGGFEDQKLFILFAAGLFLGILSFTFHIFIDGVIFPPGAAGWLVYAIGFSLLDNIMMFVVINFKWVRSTPGAPFYGISLGAGFAATSTMALVFRLLAAFPDIDALAAALLVLVSAAGVGAVMLRTSTGALLGIGSERGEPWPWFGRAIIAQVPFATLFMLLYYAGNYFDLILSIPILVVLVGYCWWLLDHIRKRMLPQTLPGQLKRRIRRQTRDTIRGRRAGPPKI